MSRRYTLNNFSISDTVNGLTSLTYDELKGKRLVFDQWPYTSPLSTSAGLLGFCGIVTCVLGTAGNLKVAWRSASILVGQFRKQRQSASESSEVIRQLESSGSLATQTNLSVVVYVLFLSTFNVLSLLYLPQLVIEQWALKTIFVDAECQFFAFCRLLSQIIWPPILLVLCVLFYYSAVDERKFQRLSTAKYAAVICLIVAICAVVFGVVKAASVRAIWQVLVEDDWLHVFVSACDVYSSRFYAFHSWSKTSIMVLYFICTVPSDICLLRVANKTKPACSAAKQTSLKCLPSLLLFYNLLLLVSYPMDFVCTHFGCNFFEVTKMSWVLPYFVAGGSYLFLNQMVPTADGP